MPRLTKAEREEAYELIKNGSKQSEIARRLKTNRLTISRLIKRITESGTTDDRPRPGRPRVMSVKKDTWLECSGTERPFVCRECAKTFKTFSNLKSHMKIHSDKPLFHCDQCGRGFMNLTGLRRHMRGHTGEKPYICEYCAHRFADISTMKTHIRTHTGERPFKCHLCGHACNTAGNLHLHMKVHRDKDGVVPRPINVKPSKANAIPTFDYNSFLLNTNCESQTKGNDGQVAKCKRPSLKGRHGDEGNSGLPSNAVKQEEEVVEEVEPLADKPMGDGLSSSEGVQEDGCDQGSQQESEDAIELEIQRSSEKSMKPLMVVLPALGDGEDIPEVKHEQDECLQEPSPESLNISNFPQEQCVATMDIKKEID